MSYSTLGNSHGNILTEDEDEEQQIEDRYIVNDEDEGVTDPLAGQSSTDARGTTSSSAGFGYIPEPPQSQNIGSERLEQRRFMGGDTLDEPVLTTLLRDIKAVGTRLRQVVWRRADESDSSYSIPGQQWDLWGPLVFCIMISTTLSMIAPNHQSSIVFSGLFSMIWLGQVVVTLNIKLLGGSISFFHALCVIGYSLFPLVIASILSAFVSYRLIRLPVDTVLVIWAIYSATNGLRHSGVLPSRVFLASFPVGLLFVGLGWLCVVS